MMHIPMTIVQPYAKREATTLSALRVKMAVQLASEETGVSPAQIMGSGRTADVTAARQFAYAKARAFGLSYAEIGRAFGRHHTSVMHGVRKHGGAQ